MIVVCLRSQGSFGLATIAILAIILLFFAYKMSPSVCMLVLMATCGYFGNLEVDSVRARVCVF